MFTGAQTRYDHRSFLKPIYFTWMLKAVVNYAQPITRWRHRVHDQKVVLNKLFLLHERFVISPCIFTPSCLAAFKFWIAINRIC